MPKRWTILLLLFSLAAGLSAQDFTYTTNNGTITITRYTGTDRLADLRQAVHNVCWLLDRGYGV